MASALRRFLFAIAIAFGAAACQHGASSSDGDPALPGIAKIDPELTAKLAASAKGTNGAKGAKYTNRLALESSPYLREHAHNPVNWYAWGDEAFARARREHKPIFLSIGYATCHWCHVMATTVFEDEEVATYLNQHFIAIKVDREERPDVDDVYMRAVQAMTGSGGWPMTVIATPDGEPFFGGTYIPRERILPLLRELREAYDAHPDEVAAQAREVSARIAAQASAPTAAGLPDADAIDGAVRAIGASFDAAHGGFGGATKFPEAPVLDLLLRAARARGDASALAMAVATLDAIAAGGIHDPIGGGFHRYATDVAWRVPHFEKMLYDNALLSSAYVSAWQLTGRGAYRDVAIETLDFIDAELGDPRGGFHAALDADSPGARGAPEEGAFYRWTYEQLVAVVGAADAPQVAAYLGDRTPIDPAVFARARPLLRAARAERARPPSD
ncbi:MAG TPA: DUF255 domain-containing protein, partial [Kofleriaceae bacterium]|nr:DUF255 domain-containing protein [Kofleriaceae bacterium]